MRASASRTVAVLLSAAWIAGFALAVQPDDSTGGADSATESGASVADAADSSTASIPAPARTTRLQGSALEGRRKAVVGAAVAARATGTLDRFLVTSTDPKGRFRIDGVPDGTYDVIFLKEGYGRVEKQAVEVTFPFRPTVEVQMSPGSGDDPFAEPERDFPADEVTIRGRVRDSEGRNVPDVLLRLIRRDGSRDPVTARSGPDGTFEVSGVPTGWWDAEVLAVGFLPLRAPLPLERSLEILTQLVPHPTKYESSPIDLLPAEHPIPPADLASLPTDRPPPQ